MRTLKILIIGILVLLITSSVWAAPAIVQDADGGKDTPFFTRMKNYYISEENEDREFDAYEFVTTEGKVVVEGRKYLVHYSIREGYTPASELQIIRNYGNEVLNRGGKILFDGKKDGWRTITLKYLKNGSNIWVEVMPWSDGEYYNLTIILEGAMQQEIKGKR